MIKTPSSDKLTNKYSYCLINKYDETILKKGNIKVTPNNNDQAINVKIELKVNITEGVYHLQLFDVPVDKQEPKRMKESIGISIKK